MTGLSVTSKPWAVLLALSLALPALSADWSAKLAAGYLDSRQQAWSAWPRAAAPGGTCISCHTGLTYLLVRPALRRALGEAAPTQYEAALTAGMRTRLDAAQPKSMFPRFTHEPLLSQGAAVEAILSSLLLASQEASQATLSAEAERAFAHMWSLQIQEGAASGGWGWFSLGLSPWEAPESGYYGAALALEAVATAPATYRNRPDVQKHLAALTAYLRREFASQPLHHRLIVLTAARRIPDALPGDLRRQTIEEAWSKQRADGAWSIESLGPWKVHARAAESSPADSYATAITVFTLQRAGVSDPRLGKALAWLRTHQDAQTGAWTSQSMNKVYEPGSIPTLFMNDAATAYAVLSLLEAASPGPDAPVSSASSAAASRRPQ
ncbi:MAG TPA: hypothetical protein VG672_03390 [Bryobacteraceae bacterium]|nr:hypothetical protein [Bryobacteraceae bacterium]